MLSNSFPLPEIGCNQPVDKFTHLLFDALWNISHHLPFKFMLDTCLAHQIKDTGQPERVFEENLTTLLHLVKDVLNCCHAKIETMVHVLGIEVQLRLHIG